MKFGNGMNANAGSWFAIKLARAETPSGSIFFTAWRFDVYYLVPGKTNFYDIPMIYVRRKKLYNCV